MARTSNKQDKNLYQTIREDLGLSRDKASELLKAITPERIERIESGKYTAHPDEIMIMAREYKAPQLCNYYCAHECEIGQQYVPEVEVRNLSQIVLEMIASLNNVRKNQERLVEITYDEKITRKEIRDFIKIQKELDHISLTIDGLKLWTEKMIASGSIDEDEYMKILSEENDNAEEL